HPHGRSREPGDDEHEQRDDPAGRDEVRKAPALLPGAFPPLAPDRRENGIGLAPASARGRRHANTPSARRTSWARRRSSRSSRSAAGSSSARARTTTVALPARSLTNTSAPSRRPLSRST